MDCPAENNDIHEHLSASYTSSENAEHCFLNSREKTLALISLYKKNKVKVGTFDIKNMKKLWEVISRDLSNFFKVTISASKCENRWKTLERNYKRVVDNNNKTGRDRKFFEFEELFDEIYGKKRNITPSIVLSSDSVTTSNLRASVNCESSNKSAVEVPGMSTMGEVTLSIVESNIENATNHVEIEQVVNNSLTPQSKRKRCIRKVTNTYKRRNEILQEMKNDLKEYYEQKTQREKEKLELEKKRLEDRIKRTELLEKFFGHTSSEV